MKMFNITVIMEMKINTTLRYQYTPKWLKLKKKKSDNTKCWQACRKEQNSLHCCWKGKMVDQLWKTVLLFLKSEYTMTIQAVMTLLGMCPREMKHYVSTKTCTKCFLADL